MQSPWAGRSSRHARTCSGHPAQPDRRNAERKHVDGRDKPGHDVSEGTWSTHTNFSIRTPGAVPLDAPDHGALHGARSFRQDCDMERKSERTTVGRMSGRERPDSARTTLSGAPATVQARATRACKTQYSARATLRACATCPVESHLSHLIPANPASRKVGVLCGTRAGPRDVKDARGRAMPDTSRA